MEDSDLIIDLMAGAQLAMQLVAFGIVFTIWQRDSLKQQRKKIWFGGLGFTFLMVVRRTTAAMIQFHLVADLGLWGVVDRFVLPLLITVLLLIALASVLAEINAISARMRTT